MNTTTVDVLTVAEWEKTLEEQKFISERGVRRLFAKIGNVTNAFDPKRIARSVTCVDEGITSGLHLAGSGVLLSPERRSAELAAAGVTELTTHDGCGAFGIAFPNETDVNRACKRWGAVEARRLGLSHRHITAQEMDRPARSHIATAIYYDATGTFNRIAGLPKGFVVSRKSFSSGPGDLALCLKIAFGDLGFGKLFTNVSPLNIILLPHPSDRNLSLGVLEKEAQTVAVPYGRRVRIDGFKTAWFAGN